MTNRSGENEIDVRLALETIGSFVVAIACGVIIGIYATWLSLGLLTFVNGMMFARIALNDDLPHMSERREEAMALFTIVVVAAWVVALIGHPVWCIAHGATIRLAIDQFIR